MSTPVLPNFAHQHKHMISGGLGLGTAVLLKQVAGWDLLDAALGGTGVFALSELAITLDEPDSVVFSAPGINFVATTEGKDTVRVSGSVLVPADVAPEMLEGLKAQASAVQAAKEAKKKAS